MASALSSIYECNNLELSLGCLICKDIVKVWIFQAIDMKMLIHAPFRCFVIKNRRKWLKFQTFFSFFQLFFFFSFCRRMCIAVPNFIKIGLTLAEILYKFEYFTSLARKCLFAFIHAFFSQFWDRESKEMETFCIVIPLYESRYMRHCQKGLN